MLTISVPFCSLGLVRPFFSANSVITMNHLDRREEIAKKAYDQQNRQFFPKLEEGEYAEYHLLKDETETTNENIEDRKARQFEILLPAKRFATGIYADPDEVERFKNPDWETMDRLKTAFAAIPWDIWGDLLLRWSFFFVLVFFGTLCLTQIFYDDWINKENLSFPLAQVPLALFRANAADRKMPKNRLEDAESSGIFKNAFFWSGAILAVVVLTFGGMAHYNLINLNLQGAVTFQRIDFSAIFINEPWIHAKENVLFLTPLFIGVALLVHQEILRGVVIIFLSIQILAIIAGISDAGITELVGQTWKGNKLPFYVEMGSGAAFVFGLFLLWRSRKAIYFKALSGKDKDMPYFPARWAGICLLLVIIGIIIWMIDLGATGFSGMLLILFVLFWVFIGAIVVGRARTEAGLPMNNVYYLTHLVAQHTGAAATHGLGNLTIFSGFSFLTLSTLPGLIGSQIESLFLAKKLKVPPRVIAVAIAIAFIVAVGAGLVSYLTLSYWHGSLNLQHWAYEWHFLVPYWNMFKYGDTNFTQIPTEYVRLVMVLVGMVIMSIMLLVRHRLSRLSIPPICFIIVCLGVYWKPDANGVINSHTPLFLNFIWGPMLIAYIAKSLILKYGGMDMYGRSIPIALGLIFGHAIMLVFWNVYHALFGPEGLIIFTGIINANI